MKRVYIISLISILALLPALVTASCDSHGEAAPENLKKAFDLSQRNELVEAVEYAERVLGNAPAESPETVANAHMLLSLLYYLAGIDDLSQDAIGQITPGQVSLLYRWQLENYYLLKALYSIDPEGNSDVALAYCDSITRFKQPQYAQHPELRFLDINNRVEILTLMGHTDRARALLDSVSSDTLGRASVYNQQYNVNRARLYMLDGNLDSAAAYAHKIIGWHHDDIYDMRNKLPAYNILLKHDSAGGDLTQYIRHRNESDRLRHEWLGNSTRYQIAGERGRRHAEMLMMQLQHERSVSTAAVVGLVMLTIIVTLAVTWKYRERKNKHRIALLECERLDTEVFKRKLECELLHDKVERITDELSRANRDKDEAAKSAAAIMASSPAGQPLEQLKYMLRTQYPHFPGEVRRRYPQLTDNDIILMGCIKMCVPAAEMARALGISPASLIKSRYRLRKKLGLETSGQLTALIIDI